MLLNYAAGDAWPWRTMFSGGLDHVQLRRGFAAAPRPMVVRYHGGLTMLAVLVSK